jgi:SAM-dependent methyltransferase
MTSPNDRVPAPSELDAFRELEHRGWTDVAGGYVDRFLSLTVQTAPALLDAVRAGAGVELLDVACGPGGIAAEAARRGARAQGVDFSDTMIAEARRLHPQLEFKTGDAEQLAFDDARFDAVVCNFGLLHFAHPERAIVEAARVLRKGGRYAFTVWDTPERAIPFGLVLHAIQQYGRPDVGLPQGPPFFAFADPAAVRVSLEPAGFTDVRVDTVPLMWTVESADYLIDAYLEGGVRTRAVLRAQTPDELERIRHGVSIAIEPWRRGEAFELPTPAVLCSATKK